MNTAGHSEPSLDPPDPANSPAMDSHKTSDVHHLMSWLGRSFSPFRIATLRGFAIMLPPILTVVFFVWAWSTVDHSILRPVESLMANAIAWSIDDAVDDAQAKKITRNSNPPGARFTKLDGEDVFINENGETYVKIKTVWIPLEIAEVVRQNPGQSTPQTAHDYYLRYAEIRFLKRHLVIPMFLALFLGLMYLVGKLLAVGIGRFFYHLIEGFIHRVPIIRNVYSSVKQVTDFAFSDTEVQFNRVVAVEYPRKGLWSMGFVTGESLLDIRNAAGEPMLSVLMPTSPMPATGFTISVPKSETIDLNLTIDQAIQFCVSCGVVVPDHQMTKSTLENETRRRLESQSAPQENT
jgi:uncharacterized membrane protein